MESFNVATMLRRRSSPRRATEGLVPFKRANRPSA
jgi:hypothetical protein